MMAMSARSLGYRIQVLDPDPSCPARFVVDSCFSASLDDAYAAANLARGCDVVTIEIEKISLASMNAAAKHAPVRPGAHVLEIIQHRARQKDWLAAQGLPLGPYRVVNSASELERAAAELGCDCFVKAAQGGYDGRGQAVLHDASDAHKAWLYLGAEVCVIEKTVEIAYEISVLCARSALGQHVVYPAAMNHHEHRILDWSVIPAPIDAKLVARGQEIARHVAEAMDIVGLVAVEMFVTKSGELLVNELAPRPHNSYHASERACATSQFEQVVRAVCNLPLGSVEIQKPAAIVNLLGELWLNGKEPRFAEALAVHGVRLHLYEKQVPKAGRKMGHISAVGETPQEAVTRVKQAKTILDRALSS